jgi:hypothetical protein
MKVAWNINNVSLSGNSEEVLRELYAETVTRLMPTDAMNTLVEDYTGSTRFVDRCKDMTVVRWLDEAPARPGMIPFDDLLKDWAEIGLISDKVLAESLIVRKYEQAIATDTTIKKAQLDMAAELCVEMSIEDAIFNGLNRRSE